MLAAQDKDHSQIIPTGTTIDILAIDPGDTSGWFRIEYISGSQPAILSKKFGVWKGETEPGRVVNEDPPDILIVENYLIRPPKMTRGKKWSHDWNKGSTMRIIGSLQTVADLHDLFFQLQEPSIKPVGYGWAGLVYVKGKQGTHIPDACAHLAYFLYKQMKAPIDLIRTLSS